MRPKSDVYKYFKYRPVNKYLLDSLVQSQLYFANRNKLNDPFDCNVDLSIVLEHMVKRENSDKVRLLNKMRSSPALKRFNEKVESLGICSFSLVSEETLMWSHYADDHKGVCLLYEFSADYLNDGGQFIGTTKIDYDKNSISDWLYNHKDLFENHLETFQQELLKKYLSSKAPSWKYEEEARIIRDQCGVYQVPRSSLVQIIFGLQTSVEDKALIQSIVNKYYYGVRFCEAHRTTDDFGIGIRSL